MNSAAGFVPGIWAMFPVVRCRLSGYIGCMAVLLKGDVSPGSAVWPMSVGPGDNFSAGIKSAGNDAPGAFPCGYSLQKSVITENYFRNAIFWQTLCLSL